MPPISEKRSPPLLNDNIKENLSNPTETLCEKLNGRVPELHEIRESWLQEIELCNDQSRTQLLTQHNHLHTTDGCHYNGAKSSIDEIKRRIRTHSESDDAGRGRLSEDETAPKRPRDDNYTLIACSNNSNQTHHQTSPSTTLSQPLQQQSSSTTTNGLVVLPHVPTAKNSSLDSAVVDNRSASLVTTQLQLTLPASSSPSSSVSSPTKATSQNTVSSLSASCENGVALEILNTNGDNGLNAIVENGTIDLDNDTSSLGTPSQIEQSAPSSPATAKNDIPSVSHKSENEGSDIEDEEEFDEFNIPDGCSLSDSDEEYTGHVYLNSSDCKLDTYTDATSLPSSESNYFTPSSPFCPSLFPNVPAYITFSSHFEKGPPLPPEVQKILKWKWTSIMPKIVRRVIANSGFRLIKRTNDWMGTWEKHMKSPMFRTLRSHQKYNHLPGSFKIGRKDSVWRSLKAHMAVHGKREFGFMQKTYVLPGDLATLKTDWPKYSVQNTKWIIKPPASARGTGIEIINRWTQIPKNIPLIVQKYIERPFLINGSKFDLRLYVMVTSMNPLKIYIHTDGLARFASVQYSEDIDTLDDRCMHLTNYSINKFSESYALNQDVNACEGHKWTLRSLWTHFREQGINTKCLWGKIRNIVLRTLLAGENGLNRMFKNNVRSRYNCFELFGFDVLLDENLTPWLLEVNISPSLHSDQALDLHVKGPLIQAVLNTALYQVPPRLPKDKESSIAQMYNLPGKLCLDKRMYVTHLSPEETAKHNYFTSPKIEYREEYLDAILENLTPDDVRCLVIAEDELARSSPLERIFPSPCSYEFLQFLDFPRYYNRLLDAWEHKYSQDRQAGIEVLKKLCADRVHLRVTPEPSKENSIEPEVSAASSTSVSPSNTTEVAPKSNGIDSKTTTSLQNGSSNSEINHQNGKKPKQNGVINTHTSDEKKKSVASNIVQEHRQTTSVLVETK